MFKLGICSMLLPLFMIPAYAVEAVPWTHNDYKCRRAVHIDASQLTSDIYGFPVMIRLQEGEFDLSKIRPDGSDILVVDASSGNVLPHKLEINSDGKSANLYVKLPHIQARNIDGMLWLYYNGPAREINTGSLSDTEILTLRFKQDSSGNLISDADSTVIRKEGNVSIIQEKIGSVLHVAGDGVLSVDLPKNLLSKESNQWTFEALAYDENEDPSMMNGHGLISAWADTGKDEPLINFGKVGHIMHSDSRRGPDGQWVGATNSGKSGPGRWMHYAAVYDLAAGKTTTFLNGRRVAEGNGPNQLLPMKSIRIGGWRPSAFSWKGKIAEIRISNTARPADWLTASARCLLPYGAFTILGPEEMQGASPASVVGVPHPIEPYNDDVTGDSNPRLQWSMVPGAKGYRVEISTNPDMSNPAIKTQTGDLPYITCSETMPRNTPLYWRIAALDGDWSGISKFSISALDLASRKKDMKPLNPTVLAISRTLSPGMIDSFRADGVVGDRINAALDSWALRVPGDNPDLVGMFYQQWHTEDFLPWWGESFGKFYQGASLLYRMTGDKRLRSLIDQEMEKAFEAQEPSGYLGALLPERRLTGPGPQGSNWDLYNGHHLLMALLEYHEATGNKKALRSAMMMADLWCDTFGAGKRSIIKDIPGPDQCNLGIIAPVTWLYRLTGRQRYLDLAKFAVQDLEAEYGPQWITLGLAKKHCTEMKANHALEQFFVFEGIMDLYFVTGDTKLRDAMVHWWRDMTERERMAHGNMAPEELWVNKPGSQSWAETCVATSYIRFSLQVLYAAAESRIADMMEEATLNAYLGAQRPDGALWAYPVPVNGSKPFGLYTLKPGNPDLGCCFTYALTGMGLIPRWATMTVPGDKPAIAVNYYGKGRSAAETAGVKVVIEQETEYPRESTVMLTVKPSKPAEFGLWLRIPYWSKQTRVRVNNEEWMTAVPGEYMKIDRRWNKGDKISLELDFSPRVVKGSGETEGKVAVYRGPLLLTMDQRFNKEYDPSQPQIDADNLVLKPHVGPVTYPQPWVLMDAPGADGKTITLCDFASAGAVGERYEGWIKAVSSGK
ncbi:MAG: beta-L-arabinofuranosidase domain-containing protein [Armatimonadota bacterium]